MGRELCRQLAAAGCHVSFADLSPVEMEETRVLCEAGAPPGTRVTCHVCDVSSEDDILAFRDAVAEAHSTDAVNYVFNNAGIAGGNSFLDESPEGRARWEKTFNVDWYGVYFSSRAFIPMLKRADEAALVNTSSVNGFWASLGAGSQHSACASSTQLLAEPSPTPNTGGAACRCGKQVRGQGIHGGTPRGVLDTRAAHPRRCRDARCVLCCRGPPLRSAAD